MECPAGIKCKGEKRRGTVYNAFIKVPPPLLRSVSFEAGGGGGYGALQLLIFQG